MVVWRTMAWRAILFAGLLLFTAGCGFGSEVSIGEEKNGSEVSLKVGQTLVLTLASNPSTGYQWRADEVDEGVLEEVSHDYRADWPVIPGSGGRDIWRFKALSPGNTTLTMVYERSWEEAEPLKTLSITAVVQ
jgi:inhibitor of cysteine peptidase